MFLNKQTFSTVCFCLFLFVFSACEVEHPFNNPYQEKENGKNILYTSFSERPKHLDPVRSYASNESAIIGQIYEPPFQYHYLKRPYELVPLTATHIPKAKYFDQKGLQLPDNPPEEQVSKAIYEIKIKPGIRYQEHPAFAQDSKGSYLYHDLKKDQMSGIYELSDFPVTGNRELTAEDYVYQIKRMANPTLHCPILPVMATYIDGFKEYSKSLGEKIKQIRSERKEVAGVGYNQEQDENLKPIRINYTEHPLQGIEVIDRYTYRITLNQKYPQFIYWMAMSFFAPMPWEAEAFYNQGLVRSRQISLNWYPIGTGAYRLAVNNPNKEMILLRNENFHGELYPEEATPEVEKLGLLRDAGKEIPFIDKVVYKLEKESIPYWNKFLQGYFDTSGIASDSFDQAVTMGSGGDVDLTESMKRKNIRLITSAQTITYYIGFNMLDDVVGGYSMEKKKLRQAISIAVDYEEYIQIFLNGRGIPAQTPLPPGIFGYEEGKAGMNPYTYDWVGHKSKKKSITYAKQLLAEAGYPRGKNQLTGEPLLLYFDTPRTGPDAKSFFDWLRKQFRKIDIQLIIRATDYNRFQDKMSKGTEQIFQWGWGADYPDPENFLFLLYGPNKKVGKHGENATNYENPEFDFLFEQMATMENGPRRLANIQKIVQIIQEDAPWLWGFHPISFGLYHEWYQNAYPNLMANNTLKYKRLDVELRTAQRRAWNQPVLWPVFLLGLVILVFVSAFIIKIKQSRKS